MALTTYCELNEVRAALGVNDIELPDAVLNLPVYEYRVGAGAEQGLDVFACGFSTSLAIATLSRNCAATGTG